MTVVVRIEQEHVASLHRALAALRAEQALLERWNQHSVELTLAIDDLEELVDRYRDQGVAHPDPWSRRVPRLGVVR